jgi:polyphosphate glucokinase
MTSSLALGIDVGGSGIKGALVHLSTGDFATDRLRIPTPRKSTPERVAAVTARIVKTFEPELGDGPIGVAVPSVVTHGVTRSAANIDKSWIDAPARQIFEEVLGRKVVLMNDADAAGIAEVKFGAAHNNPGLVLVTTLGTGIGSALINGGVLVPNTELGHLELDGHDAETQASAKIKTDLELSYTEWIPRLQRYYSHVESLFWPDLFVVGGGISKNAKRFLPKLKLHAPIVPASLRNRAGIIGAAWLGAHSPDLPGS